MINICHFYLKLFPKKAHKTLNFSKLFQDYRSICLPFVLLIAKNLTLKNK